MTQITAPPLGIIVALAEEREAIAALLRDPPKTEDIAQRQFIIGTIGNQSVVIVMAGVGKVNAAATTQLLISTFHVQRALFTGVAGGVNPARRVGDVVISTQLAQHDYGMVTPDSKAVWRPGDLPITGYTSPSLYFTTNMSSFFTTVTAAAHHATLAPVPLELGHGGTPHTPRIVEGVIVTGDEFIASDAKRQWLFDTFNAEAVEMEGAAFAQVCETNGIPCVVIRTVSDQANEHAAIDFPKFAAYAAGNSAALVQAVCMKMQR